MHWRYHISNTSNMFPVKRKQTYVPRNFAATQRSTPALPSPLLGAPKNQVVPATFKGENAFWCANIIAYSCIQNLILAARDFIIRHIIKLSSQGLEACLFSHLHITGIVRMCFGFLQFYIFGFPN